MSDRPDDITKEAWEAAAEVADVVFDASVDLYETGSSGRTTREQTRGFCGKSVDHLFTACSAIPFPLESYNRARSRSD